MDDLKHLQLVILEIIKDIDKICTKNNIDYYLVGGSTIGAIRHQGFIPWDDDLDIILTDDNYRKLVKILKKELDPKKYYVQEGRKDWPLYFTKVKLKGTHIEETEHNSDTTGYDGIFVDIFKLDNVSDNHVVAHWQYFCAKYFLCYLLSQRKYKTATLNKKIMIALSFPLKVTFIRNFFIYQIERFNNKETKNVGFFYGKFRYKTSVMLREYYGKPKRVKFGDTELPVQENYHEYLNRTFGDYMKMPPVEQRVGSHMINIDFGQH